MICLLCLSTTVAILRHQFHLSVDKVSKRDRKITSKFHQNSQHSNLRPQSRAWQKHSNQYIYKNISPLISSLLSLTRLSYLIFTNDFLYLLLSCKKSVIKILTSHKVGEDLLNFGLGHLNYIFWFIHTEEIMNRHSRFMCYIFKKNHEKCKLFDIP